VAFILDLYFNLGRKNFDGHLQLISFQRTLRGGEFVATSDNTVMSKGYKLFHLSRSAEKSLEAKAKKDKHHSMSIHHKAKANKMFETKAAKNKNKGGLGKILPDDLDLLRSETVIGASAVQLLLFGGFVPSLEVKGGWVRNSTSISIDERLARITPTWKKGTVSYKYDAFSEEFSLFGAAAAMEVGATVRELVSAVENIGLSIDDFPEGMERTVLTEMLRWQVTEPEDLELLPMSRIFVLVLSFDATPDCLTLDDCPRPGPSNELLAATAIHFANERQQVYEQEVTIVAQWEISAAIASQGGLASSIGTPGAYQNTGEILELMRAFVCGEEMLSRLNDDVHMIQAVLLAHPDHLPRAMNTAQLILRGDNANCTIPELLPAMSNYQLDWLSEDKNHGDRMDTINLYFGVNGNVHSEGEMINATWYDDRQGYFPDGDPQIWVRRREVWILYDQWAKAKGLITGVMTAQGA